MAQSEVHLYPPIDTIYPQADLRSRMSTIIAGELSDDRANEWGHYAELLLDLTKDDEIRKGESPIITSSLLLALGGETYNHTFFDGSSATLFDGGGHLWGIDAYDESDAGSIMGVSNHVFKVGRVAEQLALDAKRRKVPGYENIDVGIVVQAALLHDVVKLASERLEKLTGAQRKELGLPANYLEISQAGDRLGTGWLKQYGFPKEIYKAINGHDFPQKEVDNPYWRIVLIADYMAGQHIQPMEARLKDVYNRWIKKPKEEAEALGVKPKLRIKEARFDVARDVIQGVADKFFGDLGTTDAQFIEEHNLNSDESMPQWERLLRNRREKAIRQVAKSEGVDIPTDPEERALFDQEHRLQLRQIMLGEERRTTHQISRLENRDRRPA